MNKRSVCECPRAQCVAAISGLAQLAPLRLLHFAPHHEHELAALAQLSQLHTLQIYAPASNSITFAGLLVQLACTRHLQQLVLHLQLLPLPWLQQATADCLLCGLRHVPKLRMRVTAQQEVVLRVDAARGMGLDIPAVALVCAPASMMRLPRVSSSRVQGVVRVYATRTCTLQSCVACATNVTWTEETLRASRPRCPQHRHQRA